VIDQPFTLQQLEGDRYYESVVFQVTLDNPSITAEDLYPKDVTTPLTVLNKFTFNPSVNSLWCKELIFGTASGGFGCVAVRRISRGTLRFGFRSVDSDLPGA
jgi:hypothetical protein